MPSDVHLLLSLKPSTTGTAEHFDVSGLRYHSPVISHSFQSVWMTFYVLLGFVGLVSIIVILAWSIDSNREFC